MADQLQLRGGTTSEHSTFTGALREVTVDTDKDTLIVHDAATAGGHPLLREDGSNSALSLGTAGTPSIKFTGDTNTGIYSPGADQVAISTGGSGRLFVDANGNVGVGTSSPTNYSGRSTVALYGGTTATGLLDFVNSSGSQAYLYANNNQLTIYAGDSATTSKVLLHSRGSSGTIEFQTNNGAERARIDSSGRVGIGTSSPDRLLELNGDRNAWIRLESNRAGAGQNEFIGGIEFFGNDSSGPGAGNKGKIEVQTGNADGSGGQMLFFTGSSSANDVERMRIDSSGRVGVGTTSPNKELTITSGGDKLQLFGSSAGSGAGIFATNNGYTDYEPLNFTGETISFSRRNGTFTSTQAMIIDSSGRVGVGTSSFPGSGKLQVAGGSASTSIGGAGCISLLDGDANNEFNTLKFDTSVGGPIAAIGAKATTTGAYPNSVGELHFAVQNGASTNTALVIDSSSRVGIGTTNPERNLSIGDGSNDVIVNLKSGTSQFCLLDFGDTDNNAAGRIAYLNAQNAFTFRTNGSGEDMRIDSSGRVGIGTSSPSYLLDVKQNIATPVCHIETNSTGNNVLLSLDGASGFASGGGARMRFGRATQGNNSVEIGYDHDTTGFQITRDGSALLTAKANGVGIGTTSPATLLELSGDRNAVIRLTNERVIESAGQTLGRLEFFGSDTSGPGAGVRSAITARTAESDGTGSTLAFSTGTGTTNNVEAMRIDNNQRILVGTSTARSNVKFNATSTTPTVQIETATNSWNNGLSIINNSSSGYAPSLRLGLTGGSSAGSNTLVGTQQLGKISFHGADGSDIREAAAISANVDATPGSADMPGRLVFATTADSASSPTERMRINRNGTIRHIANGTGATFSTTLLTTDSTNSAIEVKAGGTAGTPDSGTRTFRVHPNGDVKNTNNSYGALSDSKLKENIVDANSQWDDIKALQVRNYNLKEGQTHTQIGLVAQEVELVSPGLVSESPDRDEDGNDLGTVTKSVNYSVLYMKAVKALQEAMERIETLEAKVAALEAN